MSKSEKTGKVSRIRTKKKVWYPILSPKIFSYREIGESFLAAPEQAVGRIVQANLKDLTGNIKDQNAYMKFKITHVEKNVLHTTALGYELTASFIKRLVRKNADRMDQYCRCHTKDNQDVVLKGLLLTRNKTYRSVRALLRREFIAFFQEEAEKSPYDLFLSNVASSKLQSNLRKKLNKILPLKELVVRVVETKGIFSGKTEEVSAEKSEDEPIALTEDAAEVPPLDESEEKEAEPI